MKKSTKFAINALISLSMILSSQAFSIGFDDLKNLDSGVVNSILGDDSDLSKIKSAATEDISSEDAYYIGRSVAANILSNYKFYENPTMENYLNEICQTLVSNSDQGALFNGYHVKILDSTEVNAFSTPGGHILITKGLVSCADSEDALAAIIAHEIAHIQLEHGLKSIKGSRIMDAVGETKVVSSITKKLNSSRDSVKSKLDNLGLNNLSGYIDNALNLDDISNQVTETMLNGYSKETEFEADSKALDLMTKSGYSASAMVTMLEKMQNVGEFKTHPKPSERIKRVKPALIKYKIKDTTASRKNRFTKAMK